ncbi:MAG TPA: tyrosine-type recombinase/integrase [Gammaproteobacteria bacterium]|nr:tyrosine-type recombinase/integrase [Gammaproteobacteria bacterium]
MAMAEACKDKAPYIPVLMDLAILTGQRERDLLNLTRQQLTDEGILFRQSKTSKKLLVQWSPALRTAIDIALAQHEAGKKKTVTHTRVLVNTRGNPLTVSGLLSMWGKIQRELHAGGKISERFTIHDLRAKAASDGGTYQLLGHTSEKTFQRVYVRKPVPVKPTR